MRLDSQWRALTIATFQVPVARITALTLPAPHTGQARTLASLRVTADDPRLDDGAAGVAVTG